jgi:hypothetical protein
MRTTKAHSESGLKTSFIERKRQRKREYSRQISWIANRGKGVEGALYAHQIRSKSAFDCDFALCAIENALLVICNLTSTYLSQACFVLRRATSEEYVEKRVAEDSFVEAPPNTKAGWLS